MSSTARGAGLVRAAGVVPARIQAGALQVALVHRPRYDDWSWPKGKLEHGEDFASAAIRETLEETGLQVRLGLPLPEVRYRLRSGSTKVVRYWTAKVTGGEGNLEHEIDAVEWLSPTLAARRLSYRHDIELLEQVVQLHRSDTLDCWPLLVVRHAHAISRGDWTGPDPQRPLSKTGQRRAAGRMRTVLGAYAPEVLVSSPSVRCTDTVRPFSQDSGVQLQTKRGLSEEGFQEDPTKVDKHLGRLFAQARPAAICTHGPVLPTVLTRLADRSAQNLEPGQRRMLRRLRDAPMDKGEILAVSMRGTGDDARVVAVQRHRPPERPS